MLALQILSDCVQHGFGIARQIQALSGNHLKVEEGSLYPALHRMEQRGWIEAEWGLSDSNRRAKFYRITASGRKQLQAERARWGKMVEAISAVLHQSNPQVSHGLD